MAAQTSATHTRFEADQELMIETYFLFWIYLVCMIHCENAMWFLSCSDRCVFRSFEEGTVEAPAVLGPCYGLLAKGTTVLLIVCG